MADARERAQRWTVAGLALIAILIAVAVYLARPWLEAPPPEPIHRVTLPARRSPNEAPSPIAQIAAGGSSTCARFEDGRVACWGSQMEAGSLAFRRRGSAPVAALATSSTSACARGADGRVRCWHTNWGLSDMQGPSPAVARLLEALGPVDELALGAFHACVRRGGRVWCWGRGDSGLRHGDMGDPPIAPAEVSGVGDAAAISCGYNHACILHADRGISCWGRNTEGEIGDGSRIDRSAPVRVPGLSDVRQLALGHFFTCALTGDGRVHCWGRWDGMVRPPTLAPRPVVEGATAIAAGHNRACAIVEGGRLRCWGGERQPFLVEGVQNVTSVAIGDHALCYIADGSTWCADWHDGDPAPAESLRDAGAQVVLVEAREDEVCVRTFDGHTECAARARPSPPAPSYTPSFVDFASATGASARMLSVTEISMSASRTCARLSDASVRCWRVGAPDPPVEDERLRGADRIAIGRAHACGLWQGRARCWARSAEPALFEGVAELAIGDNHVCVLTNEGALRCAGDDRYGQAAADPLPGVRLTRIAAGAHHTCALAQDGALYCFGRSSEGQLGVRAASVRPPGRIDGVAGVRALTASGNSTCVVAGGRELRCAGAVLDGRQTGFASIAGARSSAATTGWLAVGAAHACVLVAPADMRCAGANALEHRSVRNLDHFDHLARGDRQGGGHRDRLALRDRGEAVPGGDDERTAVDPVERDHQARGVPAEAA